MVCTSLANKTSVIMVRVMRAWHTPGTILIMLTTNLS